MGGGGTQTQTPTQTQAPVDQYGAPAPPPPPPAGTTIASTNFGANGIVSQPTQTGGGKGGGTPQPTPTATGSAPITSAESQAPIDQYGAPATTPYFGGTTPEPIMWQGGSPSFNEATGQSQPVPWHTDTSPLTKAPDLLPQTPQPIATQSQPASPTAPDMIFNSGDQSPTGTLAMAPPPTGTGFGELQQQAQAGFNQFLGQPGQDGLSDYTNALVQNFNANVRPQIEAQAALTGQAGSPALTDALSSGYYSILPQTLQYQQQGQLGAAQGLSGLAGITGQQGLGLEQLGLGRSQLAADIYNSDLNRNLQAQQIASNYNLGLGNLMLGADQAELARRNQMLQAYGLGGEIQQQLAQDPLDRLYEDYLRRQGIAQWAITGGFGAPVGSQTTQTSGGK